MEIIRKKLVANIQNEEYLCQSLIMNTLEYNDKDGVIVIDIIDYNRKSNVYATFHFCIETSREGNKRYTITKIVFEKDLLEDILRWIINMVLFSLLSCDNLTRHYVWTNTLYSYILENEKTVIIQEVISEIIQKSTANIDDYIKKLFPNGI